MIRISSCAVLGAISVIFGTTAAQFGLNVPIETRSLDAIYAEALKESGTLNVASGGDCKLP